ncbi:MAG: hypothetical protein U0168_16565 [Nannocystaceae bacterium]
MDANVLTGAAARLWQPWAAAWVIADCGLVTVATMVQQLRGCCRRVRGVLGSDGPARTGSLVALLVGTGAVALGAGAGGAVVAAAIVWM